MPGVSPPTTAAYGAEPSRRAGKSRKNRGKLRMVESIATVPYWEVEFDKDGAVVSDGGLVAGLAGSAVRDVFFFSHGWNNSFTGARILYRDMFTMIAGMLTPEQLQATGFVGVLWPALLFPDDGPPDAAGRAAG